MQDSDADVRDWATFGLGVQGICDSEEIRDALVRRLTDEKTDVREEAMVGLAQRRDERVIPKILEALQQQTMTMHVIEAAYLMLGMQSERADWKAADYSAALRERFSLPY
jgi:HEAT repeat protein